MSNAPSNNKMKLALLNTSILTVEGEYSLKQISLEEARGIAWNNRNNFDSAIGHASTAEIMQTLLDVPVSVNRQEFCQQIGQTALVFKLNGRPKEETILSVEELEKIGYKWQILERKA